MKFFSLFVVIKLFYSISVDARDVIDTLVIIPDSSRYDASSIKPHARVITFAMSLSTANFTVRPASNSQEQKLFFQKTFYLPGAIDFAYHKDE